MKSISIIVREDFVVPTLYGDQQAGGAVHLREIALSVGAQAVREVLAAECGCAAGTTPNAETAAVAELQLAVDRLEFAKNEALRGQKLALERTHVLLEQVTTEQQAREECNMRISADRMRIREELKATLGSEIAERVRREAMESHREALLSERERHAAEREAIAARLEERHTAVMARTENLSAQQLAESRRSLEQLRTEHEGLVVKLMARLEPVSAARGGTGATTSAAALGRTFEENVERHLRQAFGAREGFHLEDVHATAHCGDLLMIFDGLRILIELKSYDPRTRVPTKEVEKLARDLAEVEPRCDAAIMISACSEITGHYSCGPLEVSSTVACVPVMFINNFLSLGEPQVTLHMTRVFLSMVRMVSQTAQRAQDAENASLPENREAAEAERVTRLERASAECARRCTGYLVELNRQSTDLLRQATLMKTGALKLRESVIALVESEVARIGGIIQLMTSSRCELPQQPEVSKPAESAHVIFTDPSTLSESLRALCSRIAAEFNIDSEGRCSTKDLIAFIQSELKVTSEKAARDALKTIFLDRVIKHGFVLGVSKKNDTLSE